jgi:hypothetical protein
MNTNETTAPTWATVEKPAIAFHPDVVAYIKATIDDVQTGEDTSSEPWNRVVALRHSGIVEALREWYDETGGEETDPRFALAFILDALRTYDRDGE